MGKLLNKAGDLIFNTKTLTSKIDYDNAMAEPKVEVGYLKPNVIIMSRETFHLILREAEHYYALEFSPIKTRADTLYGVRIVYDDTMPLEQMAVAEAFYK